MLHFLRIRWWLLSGSLTLLGGALLLSLFHPFNVSAQVLDEHPVCPHQSGPNPNIQVSHDSYQAHAETSLSINPLNHRNLVGGSKFFPTLARAKFTVGYFTSFDGGCSWVDHGPLPGYEHPQIFGSSDPTFAFGFHNDVHAAVAFDTGIGVSTSDDGGVSFKQPVFVLAPHIPNVFGDKPWITVDHSESRFRDNIYVTFTTFVCDSTGETCASHLSFSRSIDGGRTFSPPQNIEGFSPLCTLPTDIPNSCDNALGGVPTVGPDGTISVIYDYLDPNGVLPTRILDVASFDGGQTWRAPTLAAIANDTPIELPGENFFIASLPAFAAGSSKGSLYLTWGDFRSGDSDILFTRSLDNGKTWSAPLRVNDDLLHNGAEQFQPQIAVDSRGIATISFFDTRRDPQHKLVDVYLAQSGDGGKSFLPNIRVTTKNWDPQVGAPTSIGVGAFIGDYQGLAVTDDVVYPLWNDSRVGSQQIFTAILPALCRDESTASTAREGSDC
jgi:hypothetical protein